MEGTYNIYLVIVSALVAVSAGYVTLELANQVSMARSGQRLIWLALGAVSMGTGIWAMHFIAMLAFSMDAYVSYVFVVLIFGGSHSWSRTSTFYY